MLVKYGYSPTRETLNVGIWQVSAETPENLIIAASAMAAVPTIVFFLMSSAASWRVSRLVAHEADQRIPAPTGPARASTTESRFLC